MKVLLTNSVFLTRPEVKKSNEYPYSILNDAGLYRTVCL